MNFESIKFWFLRHLFWILPVLVFTLLISLPIGVIYGFQKTERVWDNLAYINGSQFEKKFDSLFDATTKDMGLSHHERLELEEKLKQRSKSWPISLLTNLLFDTLTNSGMIVLPNGLDKIAYHYNDSMIFDPGQQRFRLAYRMNVLTDSLPLLNRNIGLRLDSLSVGFLGEGSSYIMSIEEWVNTDTIRVKFVKSKLDQPSLIGSD